LKRLFFVLNLSILVLAGMTYLYYKRWYSQTQHTTTIPYIPSSAALVYKSHAAGNQWKAIEQTSNAQDLSCLPFYTNIQESLQWLQSLGIDSQVFDELPLVISIHGLSEEEVGCLFYLPTQAQGTQRLLQLLASLQQRHTYQLEERKVSGYSITAISNPGTYKQLYFIKQGSYIIASFSSLLLEEVILGLVHKVPHSFLPIKQLPGKQGSIYINFQKISLLLRVFFKHAALNPWASTLADFAPAAELALKFTNQYSLLTGFLDRLTADGNQTPSYWLHTLAGQEPGVLELAPYIPSSTIFLQHFTWQETQSFATAWQQYRQLQVPVLADKNSARGIKDSDLGTALDPLLAGEIGLCTIGLAPKTQVLLMPVVHHDAFITALEELNLVTQPIELTYNQHTSKVYTLLPKALDGWLPGHLFPTFQPCLLTTLDNYVVLTDSKTALEQVITQYKQGKTWANTPYQQAFLSNLLAQANCRLFVNIQQAWPQLIQALKPAWKTFLQQHATLKNFNLASLQVIADKKDTNSFYLSLLVHHNKQEKPTVELPTTPNPRQTNTPVALQAFKARAPIITKPFIVPTHKPDGFYILFQDALYQLYCLNKSGKLLWKKALDSPIASEVFWIDLYKNKKWQYIWTTQRFMHLIDYTGRPIKQYPHKLPTTDVPVKLTVIDYLKDKNYRFLLSDATGNMYLRDIYYRPLPGWNPKSLQGPFAGIPFHILDKHDYFLALQEKGALQALNRKGHLYPGFPIDLGAQTHNPLVVKKDPPSAASRLLTLTDTGKLSYYSLSGILQHSIQLDKPTPTTKFACCLDEAKGASYCIIRQDLGKYTVLDEKGEVLFEKDYQSDQPLLYQYYDFGNHKFYVITYQDHHRSYIYGSQGKAIHNNSLSNSQPITLHFAQETNQLHVYSNHKDQALKYVFPLDY